jgi:RimJ/RimL family protein N-acetyltransferase
MFSPRRDVALLPLTPEHAGRMFAWMQDAAVRDGIGLRDTPSPEKTDDWVRRALADPATRPFAIYHRDEHVGNVVLDRRDAVLQMARLSIYIGDERVRGRGVGSTAVFLAARFAFREWGLHKLWLTAHEENRAALAAYERVGFVREGLLRDEFLHAGRRLAAVYMGLLAADFARVEAAIPEEKAS